MIEIRRPSVQEIKQIAAYARVALEITVASAAPFIGAEGVEGAPDCITKNTVRVEWVNPDNTIIGTATGRRYLVEGSNSNPVTLRTNNQGLGIDSATNRAYAELKGESDATLANKPAMEVRVQSLDSGESIKTTVPCAGIATFEKKVHPAPGVTVTPGVGPTFAPDRGTPLSKTPAAEGTPTRILTPVKTPVIPEPDSTPAATVTPPVKGLGVVENIDQSIQGIYEIPVVGLMARGVEFVVDLPAEITDKFVEPDSRPPLRWGINALTWLMFLAPSFRIGRIRLDYPRTAVVRSVRYPFRYRGARRQYDADVAATPAGTTPPVWHRPSWS